MSDHGRTMIDVSGIGISSSDAYHVQSEQDEPWGNKAMAKADDEYRMTVAIHEGGHGIMSIALGIPMKRLTINGDAKTGYAGQIEYDDDVIQARFNLIQGKKEEIAKFIRDLAVIGVAGEHADLIVNKLSPEQSAARSAKDLLPFHAYCDLWKVSQEDRANYIAIARKYVEKCFESEKVIEGIKRIADRLMKDETIDGDQLAKTFKVTKAGE